MSRLESSRGRVRRNRASDRGEFFRARGITARGRVVPHTTHNGQRPVEEILGYALDISYAQYFQRYERGGIAEPIIEIYPKETWSRGFEIIEDPSPEVLTPFEAGARDLIKRLEMAEKFQRADVLSRIGQFAVLLIGAPGGLASPLGSLSADDIQFLAPYGQDRITIKEFDLNTASKRFGLPEMYEIDMRPDITTGALRDSKMVHAVHWTRVIHIADAKLDNDVYGVPALRGVWKYLDDLDKVCGGGAEAAWRRMDPGFHVNLDPTIILDEADEEDLDKEVNDYIHGKSRTINTSGAEVKPLSVAVADYTGNAKTTIQLVCATCRIPYRRLLGNEQGELASTDDKDAFDADVRDRKSSFASRCVRSLFDRLIGFGALPPSEEYYVMFTESDALTEEQRAEAILKIAQANQANSQSGGGIILSANEIRGDYLNKSAMEEDDEIAAPEDEEQEGAPRRAQLAAGPPKAGLEILTLAENSESRFAKDVRAVFAAREIRGALDSLNIDDARGAIDNQVRETLGAACLRVYTLAAKLTRRQAAAKRTYLSAGSGERRLAVTAIFDDTNPRVIAWAAENAARLVTEVSAETIAGIQDYIVLSQSRGQSAAVIRKNLKSIIGLRSDQIAAVERLRNRLTNARPGGTVKAGSKIIKVPKSGAPKAFIDRHAASYAERLLENRVALIARTECLPADAVVDAAVVRAVHRRWYEGYMVEVGTRNGRYFSATPNHPMLTNRGWVSAGDLTERDYLVYDARQQNVGSSRDLNIATPPSTIGEIFDSASAIGVVERDGTTTPDFHGDGMNGYVDIAWPLWSLEIGSFSPILKPLEHFCFAAADESRLTLCGSCGRLLPVNQRACLCRGALGDPVFSQASINDMVRNVQAGCDGHTALSGLITSNDFGAVNIVAEIGGSAAAIKEKAASLFQAARLHSALFQNAESPSRIAHHPSSNFGNAQSADIEVDNIVFIRLRPFSGHVFNLSTPHGYFTSNGGLYTGNTLRSANAGQREMWLQARDAGDLPEDMQRVWVATEDSRTRESHAALDGETTGIDEPFSAGFEPGEEPACRCTQGLTDD